MKVRRKTIAIVGAWLGATVGLLSLSFVGAESEHAALVPLVEETAATTLPLLVPDWRTGSSASEDGRGKRFSRLSSPEIRTRLGFRRPRRILLQDEDDAEEELSPPPPLFPLTVLDLVGFGCATLGLILAAGGGIGGGGILIPTFCLVVRLPVKHAISLTSITILGGALGNVLLNSWRRHPLHKHRGCVDWVLTLLLEPAQIGGTLVGTYLHDFLPDLALMVLLLLFLLLTACKTISNANELYRKESLEKRLRQNGEAEGLLALAGGDGLHKSGATAPTVASQVDSHDYYNSFETTDDGLGFIRTVVSTAISDGSDSSAEEEEPAPDNVYGAIAKLTLLFAVITVLSILKGTETERERKSFWVSQAGLLGLLVAFVAWVRADLLRRQADGDRISSDIHWDEASTLRFPALSVFAGLVAGLFGIGGGIVMGPLMLELGVHPTVAAATSACMILYTSATATISYFVFGRLLLDYAAVGLILGFISTVIGQTVMGVILHRHERPSYIAYCIGVVIAVSAVCMTLESVLTILR